ncbi:MAG: PDZ domain-containing protein [Pyrinomonadaceae bacterium]
MDNKRDNLDGQRIAELIGTLPHVDAPGDFETRVRSRIVARSEERPSSIWRPIWIGVAAVAVLGFGGYLGIRSLNTNSVAPASTQVTNTVTTGAPPNTKAPQVAVPAPTAAPQIIPDTLAAGKQPRDTKTVESTQQGGSIDEASKDAHRLLPKTVDPPQRRTGDSSGLGGQIPVTMIFEAIGVHAGWNGNWQVNSVDANTVAAKSGVRAGDIIEALNGQPVGEKTSFKAFVSGKSVRVRRDGAVIDLPFKP